jgi:hypothetical protein
MTGALRDFCPSRPRRQGLARFTLKFDSIDKEMYSPWNMARRVI